MAVAEARVEDAVGDDDRASNAADSEVVVTPSHWAREGAGRELDEASGQPEGGVGAVADTMPTRPVEEGAPPPTA